MFKLVLLKISLQIPASHLSGDITPSAADKVYMKLYYRQPEIKLLYVTPEKVNTLYTAIKHALGMSVFMS